MKTRIIRGLIAIGPLFVGACTTVPTTTSAPSYEPLSGSSATSTSTLGGIAMRLNNTTGAVAFAEVSGSLTHNTGSITVNDGLYSLTDADGPDSNGTLTDGTVSLVEMTEATGAAPLFSGNYDYVRPYQSNYTVAGVNYDVFGSYGIVTSVADIPNAGNAVYNGEAGGNLQTGIGGFSINGGTSLVEVDFAAGTVDVTVTGFTAVDFASGLVITPSFDTVRLTGMGISGNWFGGGSFETLDGPVVVNVVGPNFFGNSGGNFFGYDATISAPDEVGGGLLVGGDNATITIAFIAD